jgi:cobalt/nickel transport system permease protein
MKSKIPEYLLQTGNDKYTPVNVKRVSVSFLDKTILHSANAVKSIYIQAENASKNNLVQRINPHVKFISLLFFAIVISIVGDPKSQMMITAFIFTLYCISRLNIFLVYRRIFFLAFFFGFLIVLPASLNIITPGKIILNLISFNRASHFWIYNIPENIGFTANGLQVVALVFLRVFNSVSIALLIVFTTPFPAFIKSFKIVGVPDTFLMIISLAYKYIFILSRTIEETYFALKSRLSGNIKRSSIRQIIGGRMFFIFKRSVVIYENTYLAMLSRGYNGKIKLHSQQSFKLSDFIALVIVLASGMVLILY